MSITATALVADMAAVRISMAFASVRLAALTAAGKRRARGTR